MEACIGPETAGAFYEGQLEAHGLSIVEFVRTAHAHDLPVLVDASMNLPPRTDLRRFIDAGADLVAFSGGKTIGGPQASGFLAGRADLLASVGLQQQDMDVMPATWTRRSLLETGVLARPPQNGIGRSMKTGKEEIVGLLVALRRYADHDEAAQRRRWTELTERLAAELARIPGLTARSEPAQTDGRPVPMTIVCVDEGVYGRSAVEVVRAFAAADPIVVVGDHEAEAGIIRLDPENLDEPSVDAVIAAFRERPALDGLASDERAAVADDEPAALHDVANPPQPGQVRRSGRPRRRRGRPPARGGSRRSSRPARVPRPRRW